MVIDDDDRIDGRYLEVHQGVLSLLALQAPVASDLRVIAALLHMIKHVERMGDQCVNIAKLVPLSGDEPPSDARDARRHRAHGLAGPPAGLRRPSRRSRTATWSWPQDLVRQDDVIDRLNSDSSRRAIEIGDDDDRREWAMHMMLVAALHRAHRRQRCRRRRADRLRRHRLFREFKDASHPELSRRG